MVGCISEVCRDEKKPRVLSDMPAPMYMATHWCNIISDPKKMKQERRMLQERHVKRIWLKHWPSEEILSSWIPFWFSVVPTVSYVYYIISEVFSLLCLTDPPLFSIEQDYLPGRGGHLDLMTDSLDPQVIDHGSSQWFCPNEALWGSEVYPLIGLPKGQRQRWASFSSAHWWHLLLYLMCTHQLLSPGVPFYDHCSCN